MTNLHGHDGPYQAPIVLPMRHVLPAWIDYNGHMNVAFYTMATDQALDLFLDQELGIGAPYVAKVNQGPYSLQNNISYFAEMLEGAGFTVEVRLIDHDEKRLHLYLEMKNEAGELAASCECLLMNVDHGTRRSTPYEDRIKRRLETMQANHDVLPRPKGLGAVVGIRRKG